MYDHSEQFFDMHIFIIISKILLSLEVMMCNITKKKKNILLIEILAFLENKLQYETFLYNIVR